MADHSKLEAALIYASWGWPVLPVVTDGKLPAIKDWVNEASTDPITIKRWWKQNKNANVGILAGARSGLIVLDIDPRNGGTESFSAWTEKNGFGDIIDCPTQMTGRKGLHYLMQYTPELRSCKMAEGIDLLADGRYFLAYPSHVDVLPTEGTGDYIWEASADPFDPDEPAKTQAIPTEWIEVIQSGRKVNGFTKDGPIIHGARDESFASLAGDLRRIGLSEAAMLAAMSVTNEERCEDPLGAGDLRRIAHSVARYSIEDDVLGNMSRGVLSVRALLGTTGESVKTGHYLTRSSGFFQQPSPIPWTIKKWIPAGGTGMIYGESGVGKSFIAIDIACCIVTGKQWQGQKTTQGPVVYLAGEGNYGLRQRIVAWAMTHGYGPDDLDDLMVSNEAFDLDADDSAAEVFRMIHEIHDSTAFPIKTIFIDTLNRHMSGDENRQQDMRKLMGVCGVIAASTGAAVIMVHHTGHGDKSRERGSTALRGALDMSLLVSHVEKEKTLKIECVKMKDARESKPLYCEVIDVDLGWLDEDGEAEEPAGVVVWVEKEADLVEKILKNAEEKKEKELAPSQKQAIESYKIAAMVKGRLNEAGHFAGLHVDDWRESFYALSPDKKDDANRANFRNARIALENMGFFFISDDYYSPKGENSYIEAEMYAENLKKLAGENNEA